MNRMAWPLLSANPSVGAAAQTVVFTVALDGVSQSGGLLLALRPKANALRMIGESQSAASPLAMHAAGTPPDAISRLAVGWTLTSLLQSTASLQMFNAPAPVPKVMRPPNCGSNDTATMSFGVRMALRTIALNPCSICPALGFAPPTADVPLPGMPPIPTQLPTPVADPPSVVMTTSSAPAPSGAIARSNWYAVPSSARNSVWVWACTGTARSGNRPIASSPIYRILSADPRSTVRCSLAFRCLPGSMLRSTHVSIRPPCASVGAAISGILDRLTVLAPAAAAETRQETFREAPLTPHCHQQLAGTMPHTSTEHGAWRAATDTASHPAKKICIQRSLRRGINQQQEQPTPHLSNEPTRRDLRYTVDRL